MLPANGSYGLGLEREDSLIGLGVFNVDDACPDCIGLGHVASLATIWSIRLATFLSRVGRLGLLSMESLPAFDRFVAVSISLAFDSSSERFCGGNETGRLWDGFVENEALNNDTSEEFVTGNFEPLEKIVRDR